MAQITNWLEGGEMRKILMMLVLLPAMMLAGCEEKQGPIYDYNKADAEIKAGNYEEGVRLYRKAARQGYVSAQFRLAEVYSGGLYDVTQNKYEALRWYKKAARQGYDLAQLRVGNAYENGRGIYQNEKEALRWYEMAAQSGGEYANAAKKRIERLNAR